MEDDIKRFLEKYDLTYVPISNIESMKIIYNLLYKHEIIVVHRSIECFYYGVYYKNVEKDYVEMKKYYLMAIDKGESKAMYNLGYYYEDVEKDYVEMKKYYLMAIDKGNSDAMINLGNYYYQNIEDYSFLTLPYKNKTIINIINNKFKKDNNLPKEFYESFCQWNFQNIDIDIKVKNKQYILKKTNIYPTNYKEEYMIPFMELTSCKKSYFPKDIMNMIAGYLFV